MAIDKRKAEVISVIGNLILKLLLGVVAAGIMCALVYNMIVDPVYENKLLYGGTGTLSGACILIVFRHYFPK